MLASRRGCLGELFRALAARRTTGAYRALDYIVWGVKRNEPELKRQSGGGIEERVRLSTGTTGAGVGIWRVGATPGR